MTKETKMTRNTGGLAALIDLTRGAKHWAVRALGIAAIAAVILLPAILGGCAGAFPGNPQGYSGINHGKFVYNPETAAFEGEVFGGKENDDVALSVTTPDGLSVEYSAKGADAFDGQRVRGAVEKAVSNDIKEAAPGIVDSITGSILKGVGP